MKEDKTKNEVKSVSFSLSEENSKSLINMTISGKVLCDDYKKFTELFDDKFKDNKNMSVDLYIDITAMTGFEMKVTYLDFCFGMKHRKKFRKIAIYGKNNNLYMLTKFSSTFIPGTMTYFQDKDKALEWLGKE
ncbi:MAG: STAS/SEC14 domain-containing protein [Pseudomonadota bacterium]|nr:STAS/SEC14 domain-containing protein [Pseudomonadota bacterium]